MHLEAQNFTLYAKKVLPHYFDSKLILDVGSGDINGNNRSLFTNCIYNGNDVIDAPNVTIVSKTKDLPFNSNYFDTIISTECFEHDHEWVESFRNIHRMLKPDGLFIFTCASTGRREHGTRRTSPFDSYATIGNQPDFVDYYKNLTHEDINSVLNFRSTFSICYTYYQPKSYDLYFIGIKKGTMNHKSLPVYTGAILTYTSDDPYLH